MRPKHQFINCGDCQSRVFDDVIIGQIIHNTV